MNKPEYALITFDAEYKVPTNLMNYRECDSMGDNCVVAVIAKEKHLEALKRTASLDKQNTSLIRQIVKLETQVKKQKIEIKALSKMSVSQSQTAS